jgi:hypothetical protein
MRVSDWAVGVIAGARWDAAAPPWGKWARTALLALVVGWLISLLAGALQPPASAGPAKAVRLFQLTWDVAIRDQILEFWRATQGMRLIAVCMLLLDALLLVPLYVRLLTLLTHCVRRTREIRQFGDSSSGVASRRFTVCGRGRLR